MSGVLVVSSARAATIDACGERSGCRRHVEAAERSFAQQLFAAALSRFQSAYSSVPSPRLLLRIARCQQLLGRSDEARAAYRTLRSAQPPLDSEESKELATYSAELDPSAPAASSGDALLVTANRPVEVARPFYKTWWFWTGTGLAVGGIVAALAIGLSPRAKPDIVWVP